MIEKIKEAIDARSVMEGSTLTHDVADTIINNVFNRSVPKKRVVYDYILGGAGLKSIRVEVIFLPEWYVPIFKFYFDGKQIPEDIILYDKDVVGKMIRGMKAEGENMCYSFFNMLEYYCTQAIISAVQSSYIKEEDVLSDKISLDNMVSISLPEGYDREAFTELLTKFIDLFEDVYDQGFNDGMSYEYKHGGDDEC
jgi:hypothetical protein